ncbi:MAG: hypothetical protein ABL921_21980 [Pirellula sp.]
MSTHSRLGSLSMMRIAIWVMLLCSVCPIAHGQVPSESGSFELSAPGLATRSIAMLTPSELTIQDSQGNVTRYQRAPRYDTADQQLIGFSSRQAQQVIRWPVGNNGRMQIGTLQNGQVQFAWSKMQINATPTPRPIGGTGDILPPGVNEIPWNSRVRNEIDPRGWNSGGRLQDLPQMTAMHLAAGNPNDRQFLSIRSGNQFGFVNRANDLDSAWYISPVSNNVVRLQQVRGNDWFAIGLGNVPGADVMNNRLGNRRLGGFGGGAFPRGGSFGGGGGFRSSTGNFPLSLLPIHNGADQLWRIVNLASGGYCFESVLYPGMGLTCLPGQGLNLQPITYDPWQVWWPQVPAFALPQPQFRTMQQQIIPNSPLPPAMAQINNAHTETLIVLLADRRNPQQPQKLRIPARGMERVQLERDAGATIVETIETMDSFGNWQQQQFNTPIPPNVLYDVSVYEEFLQSIAIDRTGKSPNPIEDVNYQPRSIGFFLIPPGDELPEQVDIDVFRIAEDAQNPGAVRRMSQRELERGNAPATTDPLKELLNKFQKQRGAF